MLNVFFVYVYRKTVFYSEEFKFLFLFSYIHYPIHSKIHVELLTHSHTSKCKIFGRLYELKEESITYTFILCTYCGIQISARSTGLLLFVFSLRCFSRLLTMPTLSETQQFTCTSFIGNV